MSGPPRGAKAPAGAAGGGAKVVVVPLYAGGDFLLAAEHDGDSLTGMELLGNAAAAPGILGALGFSHGHFRTPGTALPGAMFRPLRPGADAPGYFGLIFD